MSEAVTRAHGGSWLRGRRVLRVLTWDPRASVRPVATIVVGILFTPCVIGIPIVLLGLGALMRAMLAAARQVHGLAPAPPRGPRFSVLVMLGCLIGVLALGSATIAYVLQSLSPAWGPGVSWLGAGALLTLGAALAPLAFAPLFATDGAEGWVRPFFRSFDLTRTLGPARVARLGIAEALLAGLTGGAILLLLEWTGGSLWILIAPLAAIPGPPIAAALLADAYCEARRLEHHPTSDGVAPGIGAPLWALGPAALILLAAFVAAALTPAPLRRAELAELDPMVVGPRLQVPGSPVIVSLRSHAVVIETPDGGGAGAVAVPSAAWDPVDGPGADFSASLVHADGARVGGPPGSDAVGVGTAAGAWVTVIDERGVRLDDGLDRRLLEPIGAVGRVGLLVALVLTLAAVWVVGRGGSRARTLAAPPLLEPSPAPPRRRLAALDGVLHLADDARARYRPSTLLRPAYLLVEGEGWIEADGGALRLRLPDRPVRVFGDAELRSWDAHGLVVLSTFEGVEPTGLRTSSVPLPADAELVLGTLGDAAALLGRRTGRRVTWLAVPALVVILSTAGWLFLSLRL